MLCEPSYFGMQVKQPCTRALKRGGVAFEAWNSAARDTTSHFKPSSYMDPHGFKSPIVKDELSNGW